MIKINLLFQIQEIILYKKFDNFYKDQMKNISNWINDRSKFYKYMWLDWDEDISLYTQFLEYILYNKKL